MISHPVAKHFTVKAAKFIGSGAWELIKKKVSLILAGAVFILITTDYEENPQMYKTALADVLRMVARQLDNGEHTQARLFEGKFTYTFKRNPAPLAYDPKKVGPYEAEYVPPDDEFMAPVPVATATTEELPARPLFNLKTTIPLMEALPENPGETDGA